MPLPVPEPPDVIRSHWSLLLAVQLDDGFVEVTCMLPVDTEAGALALPE